MENHYRHRRVWLRCIMAFTCLLFTSLNVVADDGQTTYTAGQKVTFDGNKYAVSDATKYTLSFRGTDNQGGNNS